MDHTGGQRDGRAFMGEAPVSACGGLWAVLSWEEQ